MRRTGALFGLVLTVCLLLVGSEAQAAPPTGLTVTQHSRVVTASWTLTSPTALSGFLEFSPTSATDSSGFFTDPATLVVGPFDDTTTSYDSSPFQFAPGTYYVHVSSYEPSSCNVMTGECVDEFSTPPVVLTVPPDPPPPPAPPPPPPPAPVTADTATSFSKLAVASAQKASNLVVQASMPENGTITVSGTVSVPNSAKVFKLKRVSASVTAGKTVKIKLSLAKKALKAVKKALKRHKKVKANLTIVAKDLAGNSHAEKRSVKLR
jgi:hypothetical protein